MLHEAGQGATELGAIILRHRRFGALASFPVFFELPMVSGLVFRCDGGRGAPSVVKNLLKRGDAFSPVVLLHGDL